MRETYLSRDFRVTAAQCFPSQVEELNAFFDARLNALLAKNADASRRSNTTSRGRYYRALRPTKPCSGSCRRKRRCRSFTAIWSGWRERAINSLPPHDRIILGIRMDTGVMLHVQIVEIGGNQQYDRHHFS